MIYMVDLASLKNTTLIELIIMKNSFLC